MISFLHGFGAGLDELGVCLGGFGALMAPFGKIRACFRKYGPTFDWLRAARLALIALVALTGCGKDGNPVPPAPRGPLPAGFVEARQIGSRAVITFTVPQPRGSDENQQPVSAEVLRVAYQPGLTAPVDPEAFRLRGEIVARVGRDPLPPGLRVSVDDPTVTALEPGLDGWTLRYAVRVRDRRGRPSPLVAAADLRTVMAAAVPAAPTIEATADGIRLTWNPGAEGTKFNVYRAPGTEDFGERPMNAQPLSATAYLDAAVETGVHYRYVVRALAGEGTPMRESASSPEAAIVAEDRFAPAAPEGLVAVQEGNAIRLFWTPNAERDLAGYRLYKRVGSEDWRRIGPDPIPDPLFLDSDVAAGTRVGYRVTAVDRAETVNESKPSEPSEVDVVADPLQPSGNPP